MKTKKLLIITASVFFLIPTTSYAKIEYVTVIKILGNGDKGIIERANGEQWLIEKGVGAISFSRCEGKKVIISSPGIFCGVGSKVILTDNDQSARIWNAELLSTGDVTPSLSKNTLTKSEKITDMFTPEEKAKAGLSKLSPSEIDSLNVAFLRVIQQEGIENKLQGITDTNSLPTNQSLRGKTHFKTGGGHWISKNIDSGAFIKLEDGSLWEISPIDKINSMLWLPISNITIIESKNPLYPYLLVNDDGTKVEAKLSD